MAYEIRENSGSLFKNSRKEKESHPDRQGKVRIGGVEYYISGWVKKKPDGEQWMSLAFKPVVEQGTPATDIRRDLDDEIPF